MRKPSTESANRESWTTWHGRRTHKIFYRVRQPNSHYTIVYEKTQSITAGYKGYVYVDQDLGDDHAHHGARPRISRRIT